MRVSTASVPNIIFILVDDMGYGDFGAFNEGRSETPTLDALMTEGVCLTQHYTGSPVCNPSRAALLTGRYPHRTGSIDTLEWPSGPAFPVEYFDDDDPWSLTLNPASYQTPNPTDVTVTVHDVAGGVAYTLNDSDDTATSSGEYFTVNTQFYGVAPCIIFRPGDAVTYDDGDRFDITIVGVKRMDGTPVTISYSVEFFALN